MLRWGIALAALKYLCLALFSVMLLACSSAQTSDTAKNQGIVDCIEPRPEICHKMRRPVCATRDNGVRCVTTPCDSTDEVSFANECLACADPAVYSYRDGACKAQGSND